MNSEESRAKIQTDNAYKRTQVQLLQFNKEMHYGLRNKNSDLEIDLEIIFSASLKWKNQVNTAANRANQMFGRIMKSFALFDCKLMRTLYLTFIRPYDQSLQFQSGFLFSKAKDCFKKKNKDR